MSEKGSKAGVSKASTPFPLLASLIRPCDPALLDPFIAAARELEADGIKAITTSCGFAEVSGLPVFDINTLINFFYRAAYPVPFLR
ncbi:hypothetical protein ABIB73_001953 [Bradyrhizobium sp. F1.4.3]|uniref:hypothetical protein n=1 Tax=Bradyrhizobium sp. F1.4.3 TaxID=3156356 RepID=UPI0033935730